MGEAFQTIVQEQFADIGHVRVPVARLKVTLSRARIAA
jgi:hypothetical protein